MTFLSIVIPVWNASAFIGKGLQSIWDEKLPEDEYEVICVDDCSTDYTLDVLHELQAEHSNLRILKNTENLRAGGARNHGVREAKGEYMLFIDADDYVHPGGLRKAFYYLKEHDIDLLMIDHARDIQGKSVGTKMIHYNERQEVMTGRDFAVHCLVPFSPWGYVFRRRLMTEGRGCWFVEKVTGEDIDWSFALLLRAATAQYQPIILSHIVILPNSVTATQHASVKTVFDVMKTGGRIVGLSREYADDTDVVCQLNAVARCCYARGIKQMLAVKCYRQKREAIRELMPPTGFPDSRLMGIVRRYELVFSALSDVLSPLLRIAVAWKRKLRGRLRPD